MAKPQPKWIPLVFYDRYLEVEKEGDEKAVKFFKRLLYGEGIEHS